MQMSEDAAAMMRHLAERYVARGFPNYKTWGLTRPQGDRLFPELQALGLIEQMGRSFRLTAYGHQWVMENRPDLPAEPDGDDQEAQELGEGPFFNLLVTASEGAWDSPQYVMDARYPSGQRRRDEGAEEAAESRGWKRTRDREWHARNGRSASSAGGIVV